MTRRVTLTVASLTDQAGVTENILKAGSWFAVTIGLFVLIDIMKNSRKFVDNGVTEPSILRYLPVGI